MVKRGVILAVLSLLLLPLVFASHSATITSDYNPIYETNPVNVTLTVENGLFSSHSINSVNVQTNGFAINNIAQLLGWTLTNNNSINFFTTTNAISNWGSQNFGFTISADNVAQDTQNNWTVTTTDTDLDSQSNTLQFTILNDNTAPIITSTLPGAFIPGNNELFEVDANDPETGINSANLYFSNCDLIFNNQTNTSSMQYTANTLICVNGLCSLNKDLTAENEGDICFRYDVSNNGGEISTTNNLTSIIDRTAPSVTLTSPNDGVFIAANSVDLIFSANDNYDNDLNCSVDVNGNPNTVNGIGNLSYNLAVNDGIYTWFAACTDEVALIQTTASRTFTVDNSSPNITITSSSVTDRGNDAIINVSIEDLGSGVNQSSITAEMIDANGNLTQVLIIAGQITYPTTIASTPGVYTVIITADDNLGQQASESLQFRVRETFAITLTLSQSQIDASTPNNTRYVNLTGNIAKDDSSIPSGIIDITKIMSNESVNIDNLTGNFETQIEIPQTNGMYTIFASFINGLDTFTRTVSVNVGPYCGNNIVDSGEECDSSTAAICDDYGFSQGTVSCSATCTIDTSQCSNPGNSGGNNGNGGGSGGGSHGRSSGSSNGFIYTPPVIEETEELIEQEPTSGIIETVNLEPEAESKGVKEVLENEEPPRFIVGAAISALENFTKKLDKRLIIAALLIGLLLYVLGWKREDDWDRYFRKYGHH
ncbi:TPA: hypothetical protein HA219_03080 [Candidatus Woesearchaeota archaeon]|nr:hypothetical protein [Candidatus Woesearchaeota archaeon]HIH39677.1 hypothetical protein [Candidatus Woesearchaeota archaeon]